MKNLKIRGKELLREGWGISGKGMVWVDQGWGWGVEVQGRNVMQIWDWIKYPWSNYGPMSQYSLCTAAIPHTRYWHSEVCVWGWGGQRQGKGGMGEGHRTLPMLIPLFDLPFRRMMNWHWCSLSSLSADESCSTSGINIASLGLSCASLTWLILMAWGYSWPRYGEGSNRRKTELMGLYSMSFLLMV